MSITLLVCAAVAKLLQSCLTLCDPIDGSPPGSPFLGFSRQEHWSGLPFPSPGDLPDPGIKPGSPAFQADALTSEPPGKPKLPHNCTHLTCSKFSKMLKILQARLQQYVNHELPDVQVGFRKARGNRDQIANIRWITEKTESSRKTSISALLTMPKPSTVWITINCGKF